MLGKGSGKKYLIGFALASLVIVLLFSLRNFQYQPIESASSRSLQGSHDALVVMKEFSDYR
jgi:hypothetical protein